MLEDFINKQITEFLDFTPTESQVETISKLSEFVVYEKKDKVFILKGYAGTGKTTLISALIKTLKQLKFQTILLAPTGRAAKILMSYSGTEAFTIHKKIYRLQSKSSENECFVLDKNLHSNTYFIVDEASMISNSLSEQLVFGTGRLLEDLVNYVDGGNNCKLIFTGDTAQLPPVGTNLSPALDEKYIHDNLYKDTITCTLRDIVRQEKESGILFNATEIRKNIDNNISNFPKLTSIGFNDISFISGNDIIESLSNSYNTKGINETIVITRSNKQANRYNEGIRQKIFWKESEICVGDYILVVRNNYRETEDKEELNFIANGDIAEIVKIFKYEELYGFRFADVKIRFPDYNDYEIETKINLDSLMSESPALTKEQNNNLFYNISEDYKDITVKKKRISKIKENPYFNALQVKFAYAVTCHKSQGGQWKHVYLDHGFLPEEQINIDFLRWTYTAFTRSVEKLYLVNFKKDFLL